MKIRTNKEKTFDANWAVVTADPDEFSLEITDDRTLSDIAYDFDGIERIERESEAGVVAFEGYKVLSSIIRSPIRGTVQITMKKP